MPEQTYPSPFCALWPAGGLSHTILDRRERSVLSHVPARPMSRAPTARRPLYAHSQQAEATKSKSSRAGSRPGHLSCHVSELTRRGCSTLASLQVRREQHVLLHDYQTSRQVRFYSTISSTGHLRLLSPSTSPAFLHPPTSHHAVPSG